MKYLIPLILLLTIPCHADFAPATQAHTVSTKNKNKEKYAFFRYVEYEAGTAAEAGQFKVELGISSSENEKYVPELIKNLIKLGYTAEYRNYVIYIGW
jgi:hypothetical protein